MKKTKNIVLNNEYEKYVVEHGSETFLDCPILDKVGKRLYRQPKSFPITLTLLTNEEIERVRFTLNVCEHLFLDPEIVDEPYPQSYQNVINQFN